MAVLARDGALHYDDIGEGPPVVLVHGITSTAALEWRGLVGALADDYRCVTPDLRGHGRSEVGTQPLRVATLADDLLALCDHLALDRPHLVGFSLGGNAVLHAVLTRPSLPASLVFIGYSAGRPAGHPSGNGRIGAPDDWPVALRRAHAHHGPDHWRTLYSELSTDWAHRVEVSPAALGVLSCPVLVVQGEGEVDFKHRQARELAATVADGRVEVVAGGDHPIHQQRPREVIRLVKDFLDRAEATR